MSRPNDDNNSPLSSDIIDEDRVRRALGLKTGSGNTPTHQQRPEQARQRHRFVADGAVPVVMLNRGDSDSNGLKDRLSAAERALENERNAHAHARRSLQEITQAHQTLQTRLGHMDLSHGETLRDEREARRVAEMALADAHAEIASLREAAALRPRRPVKASEPIPRKIRALVSKEPKPVRWWTPSYRSKQT